MRKEFLPVREGRPWHRLPRAAVTVPGRAQGQAGWGLEHSGIVEGGPAMAGGLELDDVFKVPSNPNHSLIL